MNKRVQLLTLLAALAIAAPATAATISYDGNTLVYTATPGQTDEVIISMAADDSGRIAIQNGNPDITAPAGTCEDHSGGYGDAYLWCDAPQAIRADLGDGIDSWSLSVDIGTNVNETIDGGAGDDRLEGPGTLIGGPGNDKLTGDVGNDKLDGGDGNDIVDGQGGNDQVLGGGADDGRPGENDDVRNVESLNLSVGGTVTGTDADETFSWGQVSDPITVHAGGGNDTLHTGDGEDVVDGGPGDDKIDAGFGDDVITGGPGRDVISADRRGGDCGPLWCKYPYGNDTVDVRDGEVDSVSCGFGDDTVKADANDVVDSDCEHVDRSGAAPASGPGPVVGTGKACVVPKLKRLSAVKARARLKRAGCTAKVKGHGRHVRKQSAKPGRRLKLGTRVTVTMGR